MSKVVSSLFNIARKADTIEMLAKGKPLKRVKNKFVGKKLTRLFK